MVDRVAALPVEIHLDDVEAQPLDRPRALAAQQPAVHRNASVALMDARSIAATAARGGMLTAATELDPALLSRVAAP